MIECPQHPMRGIVYKNGVDRYVMKAIDEDGCTQEHCLYAVGFTIARLKALKLCDQAGWELIAIEKDGKREMAHLALAEDFVLDSHDVQLCAVYTHSGLRSRREIRQLSKE